MEVGKKFATKLENRKENFAFPGKNISGIKNMYKNIYKLTFLFFIHNYLFIHKYKQS